MAHEKLPATKNIPELKIDIEGLRRHSAVCMFLPEPDLSPENRRLREWLRHMLCSAARHYREARRLVAKQESADQVEDGGVVFYVFEVPEQIEGCVMALYRVCTALRRMGANNAPASEFCSRFEAPIDELRAIRNQFEHMDHQIVPGQSGSGPIVIAFCDEGERIKFRSLTMPTARLHGLIEGAFRLVATLYPKFDVESAPTLGGFTKLQMTMTVEVIERESGGVPGESLAGERPL